MREYKYSIDEFYINQDNELVISGWVLLEQNYRLKAIINNQQTIEIETRNIERKDVVEAFKTTQLMCGFKKEIQLKNIDVKTIKIILVYNEEEIELDKKSEELLYQDIRKIHYNIDSVQVNKNETIIAGWAFTRDGMLPKIIIEGKHEYKIVPKNRQDVKMAYDHLIDREEIGFEIVLKKTRAPKIEIRLIGDECEETYNLYLGKIRINKYRQYIKKLIKLIKMCNLERLRKAWGYIRRNEFRDLIKKIKHIEDQGISYNEWIKLHLPNEEELDNQRRQEFDYRPLISIIVPTYNTPKKFLCEMIDSVMVQTYTNWELCIADGNSQTSDTVQIIKEYMDKDHRIKARFLDENYGISGNTNVCLELATGEYIGLFDHDDLLTPNALYEVVKVLNDNAETDFIYSDEDKVDELGENFFEPHFKPDWSPDTLRSYNYICHFSVFRRCLLEKIGTFRKEYDGSQDHDMILRLTEQSRKIVHISKILYHWRVHKNSTAGGVGVKRYAIDAGKKAVKSQLDRLAIQGEVTDGLFTGSYRVNYKIKGDPKVSILIPNKDHKEDLELCINSILNKTTYKNYEIVIIENNSTTTEIKEYYKELEKQEFIRVIYWKGEFNYSSINNFGANEANGDIFILLNNDIEILTPDWIENMLMYAQREDVGIVGAKLYYPDNTIQHAGISVGVLGVAGHNFKHQHRSDPGYFGRSQIVQNLSAVTAACLMVRRDVFESVNGLDEAFKVAFNDVDFCLRVRELGKLVVFTPYVEAYHHESKSRGLDDTEEKKERFNNEIQLFKDRWGLYRKDPYYNGNLTTTKEDFSI